MSLWYGTNHVKQEVCELCDRPATCFPPASLVSGYEELDGWLLLCDECAQRDDLDPDEYRQPLEF
jgi:hypothetical protein